MRFSASRSARRGALLLTCLAALWVAGCGGAACPDGEDCPASTGAGSEDDSFSGDGERGDPDPGPDDPSEERLCEASGGAWDVDSCGHYVCGEFPACDAVVPGCDCGEGRVFHEGRGCAPSLECLGTPCRGDDACDEGEICVGDLPCPAAACIDRDWPRDDPGEDDPGEEGEDREPEWEADALRHAFLPGVCRDDAPELCDETGGAWSEVGCGDTFCGRARSCEESEPGCHCGPGRVFTARGCAESPWCREPGCAEDADCAEGFVCEGSSVCPPDVVCANSDGSIWEGRRGECVPGEELLCERSGGGWDEEACGHTVCGEPVDCTAIIPGCDCGPGQRFEPGRGCVRDWSCDLPRRCRSDEDCDEGLVCFGASECPPDVVCLDDDLGGGDGGVEPIWEGRPGICVPPDERLCEATDGEWHELSCGHYRCGDPPVCEAIIPGCDCGEGRNFVPGRGCHRDAACNPDACVPGSCPDGSFCFPYEIPYDPFPIPEPIPLPIPLPWPDDAVTEPATGAGVEAGVETDLRLIWPPGTCVPKPPGRCEATGGTWEPEGCGDSVCGHFPDCDEPKPGCACGPGRVFDPVRGCLEVPWCEPPCRPGECEPGSVCVAEEPWRRLGTSQPPYTTGCAPLVCDFDSDCPEDSHCEGSSVCPPDVVCFWEGRPGICRPDRAEDEPPPEG